jgi:hypothetical protein
MHIRPSLASTNRPWGKILLISAYPLKQLSFLFSEAENHQLEIFIGPCLYVSDPPEIEVERSWVHSGEGYEAQLVCIVHAEPPAEVSNSEFIYTLRSICTHI